MSSLLKFCPNCGKKRVVFKKESGRHTCRHCGFLFYLNPAPCIGAIILRKNKVLLGKRKTEPYKGFWDVPGGFIEADESPEKALKREMREELGIEIGIGKLIDFFPDWYGPKGSPTLNIYYFVKIKKGKLKAGSDMTELRWHDLKNLPKKIAFKNSREVLELVRSKIILC
jgi:ADP-ribose pyrophosphatase YjhB (NUDIX family)